MMQTDFACPCGSSKLYSACCEAYLEQHAIPQTAQALMRSRYTAYALAKITYIQQTMQGEAGRDFDAEEAYQFALEADWQGLTILTTQQGWEQDELGWVEFIARYRLKGKQQTIHELSRFQKIQDRWYYMAGEPGRTKPGRNDACLCGSGKKYKKCCHPSFG